MNDFKKILDVASEHGLDKQVYVDMRNGHIEYISLLPIPSCRIRTTLFWLAISMQFSITEIEQEMVKRIKRHKEILCQEIQNTVGFTAEEKRVRIAYVRSKI